MMNINEWILNDTIRGGLNEKKNFDLKENKKKITTHWQNFANKMNKKILQNNKNKTFIEISIKNSNSLEFNIK